jgi:hypothetical protein
LNSAGVVVRHELVRALGRRVQRQRMVDATDAAVNGMLVLSPYTELVDANYEVFALL